MIRATRALPIALVAVVVVAACSSSAPRQTAARTDRNLLESEEILQSGTSDALSAVRTLRPQWLRHRGVSSINLRESIKIYVDNTLVGGPDYLRQITTNSVESMRYMDGLEATQRWGLDHGVGAIMVFTVRGR
jgi:hypothetical protein